MKTIRVAVLLAFAAPLFALAQSEPLNACDLLTLDDINAIAEGAAVRVLPLKSGNPAQCGYQDEKKRSVLVVTRRSTAAR